MRNSSTLAIGVVAACLAGIATPARAVTLSTPALKGSATVGCFVSNVGTKTAKLTSVQLYEAATGASVTPTFTTCGAVLEPRTTCTIAHNADLAAFCQLVGSGKLRLSVVAISTDGSYSALPGTK